MADTTFAQFTLEASPAVTDYLVGYRTNISGGERRTTISSLYALFQAQQNLGITFTGVASPTYANGKLLYDTDNDCLTFYNSDSAVSLQIGQEAWVRVKNVSGSSIANGAVVYVSGSSSGLPTIALAQANSGTTTVGLGLATETIANGAIGFVTSLGLVHGLNTAGFSVGAVYISASVAGALTQTAPSAPNYRYRVGFVTSISATTGTIHVTPSTASVGIGTASQLLGMNAAGTGQEYKDITYTSPILSVPDAFVVSSAGSIGLTAGGSNKNVTLTPSDAGAQGAVTTRASYASQTIVGTGGLQVVKEAVSGSIFPSIELIGYQNGQTAQMFYVAGKAGGTAASPTTTTANATVGGYRFYARANGLWKSIGNWSVSTSPTWSDSDFSSVMSLGAATSTGVANHISIAGGNGSTGLGSGMAFGGSIVTTTAATTYFTFDPNGNTSRASSWGTTGAYSAWAGRTATDTVSTGTVATAVANSWGQPTFAASSATTFTNAATVYIAGDVAAGLNVTLTNSYGLWNVGKTRLDGAVKIGATASVYVNTATGLTGVVPGINVFGADATSYGVTVDTYGAATSYFIGRHANGTGAVPTAIASTDVLAEFSARGYNGAAYSGGRGLIQMVATESWDSTHNGTNVVITTTPTATTAPSVSLTIGGGSAAMLTGGTGNMTITAGTGASRTLAIQTTTSGSAATAALTLDAGQSATFANNITLQGTALITKPGGTIPIFTTNTAITTGAGAQAGTLLNAPAAGNPTKWIPINDNGTTRYIPAW